MDTCNNCRFRVGTTKCHRFPTPVTITTEHWCGEHHPVQPVRALQPTDKPDKNE